MKSANEIQPITGDDVFFATTLTTAAAASTAISNALIRLGAILEESMEPPA
jgi:hypothetical protein